jgi:hypothetical protein
MSQRNSFDDLIKEEPEWELGLNNSFGLGQEWDVVLSNSDKLTVLQDAYLEQNIKREPNLSPTSNDEPVNNIFEDSDNDMDFDIGFNSENNDDFDIFKKENYSVVPFFSQPPQKSQPVRDTPDVYVIEDWQELHFNEEGDCDSIKPIQYIRKI